MNDMSGTILPKSDQLNADQLLAGPITIRITGVSVTMAEQPVTIEYEGANGRPYKPGKSMRRVMVKMWGPDANAYIGRFITVYCDASVRFGGMEVGGIRISHMSHIEGPVTMALTETKGKKKPFTVRPLVLPVAPDPEPEDAVASWVDSLVANIGRARDHAALEAITAKPAVVKNRAGLSEKRPELAARVSDAIAAALAMLDAADAGEMEV